MITGFPLGEWDLHTGYWYPNNYLLMEPKEQYKHNLKYGFEMKIPECLIIDWNEVSEH